MSALIDHQTPTTRFSVKNDQTLEEGLTFLHENGYAVFSDVLNTDEINTGKDLLWKFIETTSKGNIKREDPDTWSNSWPSFSTHGVMNRYGIGQSEFLWHVRSVPEVKRVFSRIWNDQSLLVSFDGCGVFRDWRYKPEWKTNGGWNHVDQNPVVKPDLACVQGLIPLTDQSDKTGGLLVYPRTHLRFHELASLVTKDNDFIKIPDSHPIMENGKTAGKLVHAKAGDLILWDSRLIHCNAPAENPEERNPNEPVDLLRIVAYVCMMPVSSVRRFPLEEFREKRKELVENCRGLTHWCSEFALIEESADTLPKLSLDQFNEYQKALIFGYEYKENH